MGKNKYQGQKKFSKHKEKETYDDKMDELIDEAAKLSISVDDLVKKKEAERLKKEEEEGSSDEEETKTKPAKKAKGRIHPDKLSPYKAS